MSLKGAHRSTRSTCAHTHTHTRTHTRTHAHTLTLSHTHTHTHTHTTTNARTHKRIHTHIHTQTHTQAHTRTHTHTIHTCMCCPRGFGGNFRLVWRPGNPATSYGERQVKLHYNLPCAEVLPCAGAICRGTPLLNFLTF